MREQPRLRQQGLDVRHAEALRVDGGPKVGVDDERDVGLGEGRLRREGGVGFKVRARDGVVAAACTARTRRT